MCKSFIVLRIINPPIYVIDKVAKNKSLPLFVITKKLYNKFIITAVDNV